MATKLFVLMLGVAFVYVGYAYSALARRMRSYKSVQGRVVAREVVVVPSGDTTTGRWGEGGGYTPQVTYRYVVDGVELESNKIARAIRGYKRAVAERKLVEIPERVVVWYDPSRPSEAYLERHGPALGYAILGLGVVLTLGALLAIAGCARDNPPAKPAPEAPSVTIVKADSSAAPVTARLSPEKADALGALRRRVSSGARTSGRSGRDGGARRHRMRRSLLAACVRGSAPAVFTNIAFSVVAQ